MNDRAEQAIEEALEGKPRASEFADMIDALEVRRSTFERERTLATSDEQRKTWNQRLREVDRQINLLREEMAITDFVERSVRAASTRPRPVFDGLEDE